MDLNKESYFGIIGPLFVTIYSCSFHPKKKDESTIKCHRYLVPQHNLVRRKLNELHGHLQLKAIENSHTHGRTHALIY